MEPGKDVKDSWIRHLTKKCKKNPRRKKDIEKAERKAKEQELADQFNPEDTIPKNGILPTQKDDKKDKKDKKDKDKSKSKDKRSKSKSKK